MSRSRIIATATALLLLMSPTAASFAGAQTDLGPKARRAGAHAHAHHSARSHHRRHRRHHAKRHKRAHRSKRIAHKRLRDQAVAAHRHKSTTSSTETSKSTSTTESTSTGTGSPTTSPSGSTTSSQTGVKVAFSPGSPWNVPIPAAPALDPNSASIAGYLGSELKAYADLYEFGTPVWEPTSSDPLNTVTCTERWGTCQLSEQQIPIPAGAETSGGSDGSMVVIDSSTHTGYDFWRASRNSLTSWSVGWGTRFELGGSGTGGGATGAGVPLLAGLPRLAEMAEGQIDHALAFASNNTCSAVYRYPASKTDGKSTQANCIPEGARIQLDPSIDVDAIPGITPGEKIVARALQTYGAYCKDTGGAKLAFGFENPAGKPDPYPNLGFNWDYYDMPHIPWNRLRVLSSWSG
ncbi:MAG: hypothetical protein ACTHM1_02385 [Solirubrobacteraceae bacterium]